ncbi:MAG: sulfotransferase [Paracoccaceae bacterium]
MPTQVNRVLEIVSLHKNQDYLHATEAAHRYLQQYPEDEVVLQILGDSAIQSGNIDVGEKVMTLLLQWGRTASRLQCMSTVRAAQGNLAEAERLLQEALRVDPGHAGSWSAIANLRQFQPNDPLITKAKRALRWSGQTDKQRRAICYALCKAMNDLRKWDQAWDYAAKGAALAETSYNPDLFRDWLADVEATFDAEFLEPLAGRGLSTNAPIFIVGMPRSGTTLMESILAASDSVSPMGEMMTIAEFAQRASQDDRARGNAPSAHGWVRRWNKDAFRRAGDHYLSMVAQRYGGNAPQHFSDKLPNNVLYLGQIGLIFPNARIIRMHRNALDTCVSCYLGELRNGHDYTYRTDWLADAALGYGRIGDYLSGMIPNPVLDVCYEDLVSQPEPQIRRVLDFIGVEWNADCLEPAMFGYSTTTRSAAQVRGAINTNSVGRWRRYANKIAPLADALGVDLATAA